MHLGLIGSIGPAATDYFHGWLIKAFEKIPVNLDLTIVHAETPTLLHHLAESNATAQTAIFERLTYRLKAAGAQSVAVTSIAGHLRQPGQLAGARRGGETTDGPNVSLAPFRCPRVGVPSGTHAIAPCRL